MASRLLTTVHTPFKAFALKSGVAQVSVFSSPADIGDVPVSRIVFRSRSGVKVLEVYRRAVRHSGERARDQSHHARERHARGHRGQRFADGHRRPVDRRGLAMGDGAQQRRRAFRRTHAVQGEYRFFFSVSNDQTHRFDHGRRD